MFILYLVYLYLKRMCKKNMNLSLQLFCIVYAGIQLLPKPLTTNGGVKVALFEISGQIMLLRRFLGTLTKPLLSKPISQLCDKSEQNNEIKVKYTAMYKLYIKLT